MLSTAVPRRTLHNRLTTTTTAAQSQTRSYIYFPFCNHYGPRPRRLSDAERLLALLQRQRMAMRWKWEWEWAGREHGQGRGWVRGWEWAGKGRGWVWVDGGSGGNSEEYDIDLITLRKVPRRAEGVVEARGETGEKVEKGSAKDKEKEKEKKEKERAEKEKERAEKEKERAEKEKERAEKEKERAEKEKERAEKEREKAEKEREKAEKERKEKEKAEREKKEKEREKEKERKEKEKKEKEKKEKKEKEREEKEKAKEKESKPSSAKDSSTIDLPVKNTTNASTSEILAKIIKGQTDKLHKMAPPTLPEKPTGRKEVATPAPDQATAKVARSKSQTAAAAQNTKVDDLTKVAKEAPSSCPTSIKTDNITTTPTTGTIPATAVPKNEQATVMPQIRKYLFKSVGPTPGKDLKEAQESPDADIDHLLPSDIRAAAGIPLKAEPKAEPKDEKAKQHTTTTQADTNIPPQKKPRESPEELRKRMRRIADSLDLGPIDKFIPPKDHHDHHDYEWSGTENVSTEDVLKHPAPPSPPPPPPPPPATEPLQKPTPTPTSDLTPLIEPVVPTMPFTEPPTLPPQSPLPTPTTTPKTPPPPPPTPKNYYILVRNPDTGAMHFTPLPHSLISDFPTLSRESTAFDAMRRLTNPEAFLPLWRVLQRGGFEVVGGERDCLVVMVDREGSRIKYGEVLKEVRGLVSPAERVARGAWERRRREEREEIGKVEEKVQEKVEEVVVQGRRPRRKIFWSAVWVAACTGAVTVGLETYL